MFGAVASFAAAEIGEEIAIELPPGAVSTAGGAQGFEVEILALETPPATVRERASGPDS